MMRRLLMGAAVVALILGVWRVASVLIDLPAPSSAAVGWRPIASAPIAGRQDPAAAWTGTEILFWGGLVSLGNPASFETVNDGALYNPSSGTWRPIEPAPLSPRVAAKAIWVGDAAFLWGGFSDTGDFQTIGGLYDPVQGRWTVGADPGFPADGLTGSVLVWTGEEALVFAYGGQGGAAAFNPRTGLWRDLSAPPIPASFWRTAIWDGRQMIVIAIGGSDARTTHSYDPSSDTWHMSPPPPPAIGQGAPAIWTGSEAVSLGRFGATGSRGAALNPTSGAWRTIEAAGTCATDNAVWTGTTVLSIGGAFDATSNTCHALEDPPADLHVADREYFASVWTGSDYAILGGSEGNQFRSDGAAYRP